MSPVLAILAASVTTFAATNLDDLFLLTVFFARRVPTRRVVVGQYLGFAAIVLMSMTAAWALGLAVPRTWIRFLGILPLAIGVKELVRCIRRSQPCFWNKCFFERVFGGGDHAVKRSGQYRGLRAVLHCQPVRHVRCASQGIVRASVTRWPF